MAPKAVARMPKRRKRAKKIRTTKMKSWKATKKAMI